MRFVNVSINVSRVGVLLIVSIALLLTSCGGGGGSSGSSQLPLIQALLFSNSTGSSPPANFTNAMVGITDGSTGANITNASVTMNAVPLIYNGAPTHQEYEGNLVINSGDSITLVVKVGGHTYTASGTQFTSYPTISSPVSGAIWSASNANTVTWSGGAPLANASYLLGVLDASDPSGSTPNFQFLPTGTISSAFPAYYSITAGSHDVLVAITSSVAIPNSNPNSQFVFGGYDYASITVPGMPVTSRTVGATNSPFGNILNAVTWSGTKFVAVGGPGTIFTSPDGVTWTSRNSGTGNALNGVTWSGTKFVAVGDPGIILTSPDGVTWTSRNSGTGNALYGVTWSGTQFVVVGNSNVILTSPDGVTWTSRMSGTGLLKGVTWSGTQFVAVGVGVILTSPDGVTWTSRYSSSEYLSGITWSGTQFVAVGWTLGQDIILTSPDGVTWTSRNTGISSYPVAVTWSGTEFVAVGGSTGGATILTSPDGITWSQQASGTTNYLSGITWSGTELVMVGFKNTILTSP